ncbi:MAG: hypothetical protein R3F20_11325 [Planctomycetota bacterium]
MRRLALRLAAALALVAVAPAITFAHDGHGAVEEGSGLAHAALDHALPAVAGLALLGLAVLAVARLRRARRTR